MSFKTSSHEKARVNTLLPEFLKSSAVTLVSFLKEYYENEYDSEAFKAIEGNSEYVDVASSLIDSITENRNLDKVSQTQFIEELAATVTKNVPASNVVTRKFLIKRLVDYYDARGNTVMVDAFFRLFFNKEVTVFEPFTRVLLPSSGDYIENLFIRIFNDTENDPTTIPSGTRLLQKTSGGRIIAEGLLSFVKTEQFDETIFSLNFQKNSIVNRFLDDVVIEDTNGIQYGKPYRTLKSINIVNGGINYAIGDKIFLADQTASTYIAIVNSIDTSNGKVTRLKIEEYGSGNTRNPIIANKAIDFVFQLNSPENITNVPSTNGDGTGLTVSYNFGTLINVDGEYADTKGRLSDDVVVQDSDFFQKFSYELSTDTEFSSYKNFYIELLHPAGEKIFHNTKKTLPTQGLQLSSEPLQVQNFLPVLINPAEEIINIPQAIFVVKQNYFNIGSNTDFNSSPPLIDAPYINEDYITTSTAIDGKRSLEFNSPPGL